MKEKLRRHVAALIVSFLFLSSVIASELQIEWFGDSDIRELLQSDGAIVDGVDFLNEYFKLETALILRLGAEDGPLYDPNESVIQIPYEFYQQVETLFEEIEPDDKDLQQQYSIDSMLHTLFHEFGHAVIDQFEIPVLGKEEDAVDALASVLLIEYYDNGAEMAINAAELFALESEDRGSIQEQDFWDEHSLDEQRYYTTLCHVFGSDPETYQSLVDEAGFSQERAENCEYEYQKLVEDWDTLLESAKR